MQLKMPNRITITLPDEVYPALKGYAEFIGKPAATVATDIITEMQPIMAQVTRAMKKAKKNKEKGLQELRQIVLKEIATTAQLAATEQSDLFDDNNKEENSK